MIYDIDSMNQSFFVVHIYVWLVCGMCCVRLGCEICENWAMVGNVTVVAFHMGHF